MFSNKYHYYKIYIKKECYLAYTFKNFNQYIKTYLNKVQFVALYKRGLGRIIFFGIIIAVENLKLN